MQDAHDKADSDAEFFKGRFLVEILSWDGTLHVGLSPPAMPEEERVQGGLIYTRGIDIKGRIIAPKSHRGWRISVSVLPIGTDILFGPDNCADVGRLYDHRESNLDRDFSANLWIPEESLSHAVTCLAAVWKYIHIWTIDTVGDCASIADFSFSRDFHRNLADWVGS